MLLTAPEVLPQTVAILGAGRIHDAVTGVQRSAVIHRVLPLNLTFDHRAVMGGEAVRFLAVVILHLQLAR